MKMSLIKMSGCCHTKVFLSTGPIWDKTCELINKQHLFVWQQPHNLYLYAQQTGCNISCSRRWHCLQRDAVTVHMARVSMAFLCNVFSEGLSSRDTLPLSSPDFSPSNFYLWSAMKASIYKDNLHSLCSLKEAIINIIMNITYVVLVHAFVNNIKWVDTCLQAHGDTSKFTIKSIFVHSDFWFTVFINTNYS
jgi:hypothetical protein